MIFVSLPSPRRNSSTVSFASTLYLCPILDLLLSKIPIELQPEIRLGLQEALVNAAKHGNKLDPSKTVVVKFVITKESYSWIISDEGVGFNSAKCEYELTDYPEFPTDEAESGRGLCILHEIFDQVQWAYEKGTQVKLCKIIKKNKRQTVSV
ncbi:ATP-binding protein [Aphanothece hegewaldii CCALA 016]|uniref:ATP-binding protein n=1 Tax=Aphanothece hegewaldii CCALA 016 TaxID=2107694 RepID=A0A2T1LUT2_9CHRO|nr:anti-sigma regulatory factor [Aphanothece hegewaldii]PSF35266.1 ATP-binding protein [Aphanothece hegewaldii CCALA 016]